MTKTAIKEQLKGMWNETRIVNGVNIARVCWHELDQWKIIENGETFEDVTGDDFMPIDFFRTQQELIDVLTR